MRRRVVVLAALGTAIVVGRWALVRFLHWKVGKELEAWWVVRDRYRNLDAKYPTAADGVWRG